MEPQRKGHCQSESIRMKTHIEPVSRDNITPLACSMFKNSSPNSRKNIHLYFTGQKRPEMHMQFFYMELDHIGLSCFKHGTEKNPGLMFVFNVSTLLNKATSNNQDCKSTTTESAKSRCLDTNSILQWWLLWSLHGTMQMLPITNRRAVDRHGVLAHLSRDICDLKSRSWISTTQSRLWLDSTHIESARTADKCNEQSLDSRCLNFLSSRMCKNMVLVLQKEVL